MADYDFVGFLIFGVVPFCLVFLYFIAYQIYFHCIIGLDVKYDLTKEQMKDLDQKVEKFLSDNNLYDSNCFDKIPEMLKVRISHEHTNKTHGTFICTQNGDYTEVVMRKDLSLSEQRFVLAHVCGHIINNGTVPEYSNDKIRMNSISGNCADYIALALLMPKKEISPFISGYSRCMCCPLNQKKTEYILGEISEKYKVDFKFAQKRYRDLRRTAAAA